MGLSSATAAESDTLVLFALPGVQRYIAEARTTADLRSASEQIAALVQGALKAVTANRAEVVIPAHVNGATTPAPNRLVIRVPSSIDATTIAETAAAAVLDAWTQWGERVFGTTAALPSGFPDPQWVIVPPADGGYKAQFLLAQDTLAARRRVRDFEAFSPVPVGRPVCSLSGRWPAVDPPSGARPYEEVEQLSAPNWVKRMAAHVPRRTGTPSLASIASAPYRQHVLDQLATDPKVAGPLKVLYEQGRWLRPSEQRVPGLTVPRLRDNDTRAAAQWLANSGGPWVDPDRWHETAVAEALVDGVPQSADRIATTGRTAARDLAKVVERLPATYLAVVAQDIDSMGLYLSGLAKARDGSSISVSVDEHRAASKSLAETSIEQLRRLRADGPEAIHAVPVYVGGDDLLLLTPAGSALTAARLVHDAIPASLPYASTAVFLFSQHAALQPAIQQAWRMLEDAKALRRKHGLSIGFQRRAGTFYQTVHPWATQSSRPPDNLALVDALGHADRGVSLRLVADLQRDQPQLDGLAKNGQLPHLKREAERLVRRHLPPGSSQAVTVADAVVRVGLAEAGQRGFNPVPAARVAAFLKQEAR